MEQENKIILDLKSDRLDESSMSDLRIFVKQFLFAMMNGVESRRFIVKGSKSDVNAFADALSKEKKYMDAYIKNGLNSPNTLKNKAQLKSSVSKFERMTGLKWPFSF